METRYPSDTEIIFSNKDRKKHGPKVHILKIYGKDKKNFKLMISVISLTSHAIPDLEFLAFSSGKLLSQAHLLVVKNRRPQQEPP